MLENHRAIFATVESLHHLLPYVKMTTMIPNMGKRAVERGPVADTVARRVKALRAAYGVTLDELSSRLTEAGRPILASGLSKIEQGDRRVDVDDLVALAVALGVPPVLLLTDPHAAVTELTGAVSAHTFDALLWHVGETPLGQGSRAWSFEQAPIRLVRRLYDDLAHYRRAVFDQETEAIRVATLPDDSAVRDRAVQRLPVYEQEARAALAAASQTVAEMRGADMAVPELVGQRDIESAARDFGIEWGADARGATATRIVRGDDRGER